MGKQDSGIISFIWILFSNIKMVHNQAPIMNGCVHLFRFPAKESRLYFFSALSKGKESFDLVCFCIFLLRSSIRLVVLQIMFLIFNGICSLYLMSLTVGWSGFNFILKNLFYSSIMVRIANFLEIPLLLYQHLDVLQVNPIILS